MSNFSDELVPVGGLQPLGGNIATPPNIEPTNTPETPVVTASPALPPGIGYGPTQPSGQGTSPYRPVYEESEHASKMPVYITGGVGLAVLIGIGIALIPAPPVAAPTEWEPFVAADQSFLCELPKGWNINAMGKASEKNEPSVGDGVIAKKSNASLEMTYSSVAGLIAGQLLYGDSPVPSGFLNSRAAPIHRSHGKSFKNRFRGFKETKVTPTLTMYPKMTGVVMDQSGKETVPDIRWSEYTAGGNKFGFGGKRHGYRVTVGGNQYIVNVVAECSEKDWPKLKPSFERSIVSLNETRKLHGNMIPIPGVGALPTGGSVPGLGGGFGGQ